MDIQWSPDDLAFRDEVRAFLDAELTPELRAAGRLMTSVYADHDASMQWQRILHRRGWATPAWPVEFGGCDWSLTRHYIFSRESVLAGAPALSPMGISQVAHATMAFGTAEQKEYFLPRIASGDIVFCQGYSEPESGSDLASLSMSAVADGDDLVCSGTKVWTTHANVANWMFCLVRTSRDGRKQQGITFLLIDMTSPGVQVKPVVMSSGEHIQNEEFFDAVRVPKTNVVGEIDDGWTVAKYLLTFERGGVAAAPLLQVMAAEVLEAARTAPGPDGRPLIDDAVFRNKLAQARIRVDALEMLEFRVLSVVADGGSPGTMSSMVKVLSTELSQTFTELLLEAAGPRGAVYQPHATRPGGPVPGYEPPADGYVSGEPWQAVAPLRYLNDRAGTIYAGSNEIQRNILAKSALGI
ncbi:acyl-CoA dehydrogenase family protein [Gordonia humi]|uniref:Alkylation response protein AidB-like acyl-CoA dehydrogenase n=1 Tax=Gordonia humi TaxID=686429 RepID=A0A840EPU7_9ACTN|nr:acyl-CoA dehydrogenase family protein [Gordonia humi]MBB4133511.1 alkylation response protein AidB-like acyl-CoA dehydrogenase [Gordonia humi]